LNRLYSTVFAHRLAAASARNPGAHQGRFQLAGLYGGGRFMSRNVGDLEPIAAAATLTVLNGARNVSTPGAAPRTTIGPQVYQKVDIARDRWCRYFRQFAFADRSCFPLNWPWWDNTV